MFCIATLLLTWNSYIRKQASTVESELMECRLLVNRVMTEVNRDWNSLLNLALDSRCQELWNLDPSWGQDLLLADKLSERLNQHALLKDLSEKIHVSSLPAIDFHGKAQRWSQQYSRLLKLSKSRFDTCSGLVQDFLDQVETLQGGNRLKLAFRLRQAEESMSDYQFIHDVQRDCYRDTIVTRMRSDATELQLRLMRLLTNRDCDQLADICENQVRPLLLRLHSAAEEFGLEPISRNVEESIFRTASAHVEDIFDATGFYGLQFSLAEHIVEQGSLFDESCHFMKQLNTERTQLAILSSLLQEKLNRDLAYALAAVWSAILGSGAALSFMFIMLARRVSQDISLQLETIDRSSRELANEQMLLASVISAIPTPLFWKDNQGRYQGCSDSFAKWLGFQHAADVIGRTDNQLPWTVTTAEAKCRLECEILKGTAILSQQEIPKHLQDGRKFTVVASKTPLRGLDGAVNGVLGAYMDVTERKLAEEKAAGLAKIMAECPSELYVFSTLTLELIELNSAARKSLGIHQLSHAFKTFADINAQHDPNTLKSLFAPLLRNEKDRIEYETLHRRTDGSLYPVHISALTVELEGLLVFVACGTDLTEYKKLEGKLAQAQKLESIGQLSAGIAHEINTPMQCISGNIEFLQRFSAQLLQVVDALKSDLNSEPRTWAERREVLNKIMKKSRYEYLSQQVPMAIEESSQAVQRVIEIVRAMRVMSHPGTKDKVVTDLNGLIKDAITISRNRWKYAAEVDCHLDNCLPAIEALPAELSQVFLNLMVNAADALIEKNGENSPELGRITVRTYVQAQNITIEISDNGCGMSEETKRKAFEPFFTTKEVGKGTGQGLTITYDVIVKLHGGSIDIDSTVGVGTQFRILLPLPATAIVTTGNTWANKATPSFTI